MGKFTGLLLILILLGAAYIYYTNPHIIEDLTKMKDSFPNGFDSGGTTTPPSSGGSGFSETSSGNHSEPFPRREGGVG
ncbi:hypothetical protein [Thermococcus sp. JCM 11816]|uniref:hypothetical protein n=1 Tax=Thermococcus sp. (strain JCM 11816 / KS-1) TaxID=1295125 RepID=UPI0034658AE8